MYSCAMSRDQGDCVLFAGWEVGREGEGQVLYGYDGNASRPIMLNQRLMGELILVLGSGDGERESVTRWWIPRWNTQIENACN